MRSVDKRLREERLNDYIKQGYSANKIQEMLSSEGLGMRRKVLLERVRVERGLAKRREGVEYKPTIRETQLEGLYRMSLVLLDLPIRSSKNSPNYYGFRLTAFSFSRDLLLARENQLKRTLRDKVNTHVGYNIERGWGSYDGKIQHLGTETCEFVPMSSEEAIDRNGHWYYYVEHNGQEVGASKDTGSI